jgi:ParB family chromosome partitioning protein
MTTALTETKKPQRSGLGLEGIGDLSGLLNEPVTGKSAGPLEIELDLIDEDEHQPRQPDNPGFAPESLKEMAATIRARGVKTPISVRENTDRPGRYLINHGARRVRASKLADRTTIPAFIDNDYNETDQVIENLQRNDLTPREIADFIGRELAKGKKKGDIAKELGKSPAFVTQHVTLLDLPDPIAEAFTSGRSRDVTLINELVRAYKKQAAQVTTWLEDPEQEITRGTVKLLCEFLDDKRRLEQEQQEHRNQPDDEVPPVGPEPPFTSGPSGSDASDDESHSPQDRPNPPEPKAPKVREPADPDVLKKAIVQVRHDDRPARLLLDRRPAPGFAWLKYDDGQEFESDLTLVQLVAVVEG